MDFRCLVVVVALAIPGCECGASHTFTGERDADPPDQPRTLEDAAQDPLHEDQGPEPLDDGGPASQDAGATRTSRALVGYFAGNDVYAPLVTELSIGRSPVRTAIPAPEGCPRYSFRLFYEGGIVYDGFHSNPSNPDGCPHRVQRRVSAHSIAAPAAVVELSDSPLDMAVHDGTAYLLLGDGSVVLVDALTLEQVGRIELPMAGVSIVAAGERIYVLGVDAGRFLHVFVVNPSLHELEDQDDTRDGVQGVELGLQGASWDVSWDVSADQTRLLVSARGLSNGEGAGVVEMTLGPRSSVSPVDASNLPANPTAVAYFAEQIVIASYAGVQLLDPSGRADPISIYDGVFSDVKVEGSVLWLRGSDAGLATVVAISSDGTELLRWSTGLVLTSLSVVMPED